MFRLAKTLYELRHLMCERTIVHVRTLASFSVKFLHTFSVSHINVVNCQQKACRALVSPSAKGVLLSALLREIVIVFAFYLMYGFQPTHLWETDCDKIIGHEDDRLRSPFSPPLFKRLIATPSAGTFTQPALLKGNYQSCVDICSKSLSGNHKISEIMKGNEV